MDKRSSRKTQQQKNCGNRQIDWEWGRLFARNEEIGKTRERNKCRSQAQYPRSNREVVLVEIDLTFDGQGWREHVGGSCPED